MKVYRFLTLILVVVLLGSSGRISAQEITQFELKNKNPHLPFPVTNHLPGFDGLAADELGRPLPINQCKVEHSPIRADRCGFSAGLDDHLVIENTNDLAKLNEVDLSPLSFDCMNSGCEMEYAQSARKFRESLEIVAEPKELLSKEEVQNIIESVFSNSLAIVEVDESNDIADAYTPYVDPNLLLATEPVRPEPAIKLNDYLVLAQFWGDSIVDNMAFQNPVDFFHNQSVELECQLCGSPWLNLAYSLRSSIEVAEKKLTEKRLKLKKMAAAKLAEIKKERELAIATVQRNALILAGFAKLTRSAGRTLINVSDSLAEISVKKVESLNVESH